MSLKSAFSLVKVKIFFLTFQGLQITSHQGIMGHMNCSDFECDIRIKIYQISLHVMSQRVYFA